MLPTARQRLDRLIESRATLLAEAVYEERKALDLAAVKAELADPCDPPGAEIACGSKAARTLSYGRSGAPKAPSFRRPLAP